MRNGKYTYIYFLKILYISHGLESRHSWVGSNSSSSNYRMKNMICNEVEISEKHH